MTYFIFGIMIGLLILPVIYITFSKNEECYCCGRPSAFRLLVHGTGIRDTEKTYFLCLWCGKRAYRIIDQWFTDDRKAAGLTENHECEISDCH